MAVLVAASPCALAISTPSAFVSGVARAARGGVLIKGGGPLEDLGVLKTLAFDKTGTLTEGKPKLVDVISLNGTDEKELLATTVAVERLSDHPLAEDRKSTRLNSSHVAISYAVFCLKKKNR